MTEVFEPKMNYNKALEIWGILMMNETLRAFFRTFEMTNDFIKINDLPSEKSLISDYEMSCRRGTFFANLLTTDSLTWNQKAFLLNSMADGPIGGVLIAWGITRCDFKSMVAEELSYLAYFLHRFGAAIINEFPGRPSSTPCLVVLKRKVFDSYREEDHQIYPE